MNYISRVHGHAFVHLCTVIKDISVYELFNEQLTELPIVFIDTTSVYIGVVGWGWHGAKPVAGEEVRPPNRVK